MNDVTTLIQCIREATPGAEKIYTQGACFHLFLTLKLAFPEAECWYDGVYGHVYTKIGGRFYDINGEARLSESPIYPLLQEPRIYNEAFTWVHRVI